MNLDWLIIGGGIHGSHIAARLIGEACISPDRIRIVDPCERLLDRWKSRTAITGMTHLRSPAVHHLGIDHGDLRRFATRGRKRIHRPFAPPFNRPSLKLFNAHCDQIEQAYKLTDLHIRDRAVKCLVDCDKAVVKLAGGTEMHSRNVVLAIGSGDQTQWPEWAPRDEPRVQHVFEPGFEDWPTIVQTIMVVGGGISSGHVALRLLKEGHDVHLVSRHTLRHHQFDSDPGWLGEKYASVFGRTKDVDQRRTVITTARHRGSVPPDMGRSLRRAINRKQMHRHEDQISNLVIDDQGVHVTLATSDVITVDRLMLATGFAGGRPGGAMLDDLIASASLPCAECGFPIVDSTLQWHPRVFVSGALAELELGPVSRNIAGARWAGDRIVNAIRSDNTSHPPTPVMAQ